MVKAEDRLEKVDRRMQEHDRRMHEFDHRLAKNKKEEDLRSQMQAKANSLFLKQLKLHELEMERIRKGSK
jgi:hypothetical protein